MDQHRVHSVAQLSAGAFARLGIGVRWWFTRASFGRRWRCDCPVRIAGPYK
jgi:hypothetical protein